MSKPDNCQLGKAFQAFLENVQNPDDSNQGESFAVALRNHFGEKPVRYPILTHKFQPYELGNIHVAVEEILNTLHAKYELIGVVKGDHYSQYDLSTLAVGNASAVQGPVSYVPLLLPDTQPVNCVQSGLYLAKNGANLFAILITPPWMEHHGSYMLQVMAPTQQEADNVLSSLRKILRDKNLFRGRVLSLSSDPYGNLNVNVKTLPKISRESIILPDGVLNKIERLTMKFAEKRATLLAAGRHLKRGLLLYGPPGTGKTYSAMYLAAAMKDRTVLLSAGRDFGLLQQTCAFARMLQPAMVVLEDIDLIAEERQRQSGSCTAPLLFELLNEMDGLAEDCDIIFLLTTNRPEFIEPALSARPGRIDQAIEIPLPDAPCRQRLIELYGEGLNLTIAEWGTLLSRTEGASAAFIKEMLRRAALVASEENGHDIKVNDTHVLAALRELVVDSSPLTKTLLGYQNPATA